MIREIFGLATLVFSGWYELSTARVCKKKLGEVIRDAIVFLLSFLIIYGGIGDFYFYVLDLLKREIKGVSSFYLSLIFAGFLSIATFRSAAELVRAKKRGEEKEDPGFQAIKIGSLMVLIFLGLVIALIFILSLLGIRWWEYEWIIWYTLAGWILWMVIWFNLPGTYSPRLFKFLTIFFSIVHLVFGILCAKAYEEGWRPMRENYFEFVERKKKEKEKILAFKRERMLKKLPPRKAVTPREILIPRMIYFDQEKRIKVFPKERVKMIFVPNYNWIYEGILGYEVLIEGIPYCEVKEEELKGKESVIREFRNKENIPKEIIVRVSRRVLFE